MATSLDLETGATFELFPIKTKTERCKEMRIKSSFRDYYDYVEFLYNPKGGDPSETYLRGEIKPCEQLDSPVRFGKSITYDYPVVEVHGSIPRFPELYKGRTFQCGDKSTPSWTFKWCSFCGKLYLLISEYSEPDSSAPPLTSGWGEYKVITEDHPVLDMVTSHRWGWEKIRPEFSTIVGLQSDTCVRLSNIVNAPVFLIEDYEITRHSYNRDGTGICKVCVNPAVPNLGKLGFPSILPPEQAYQEISMFLGTLRDNPDNNPPVNVSDKDRLVQKGFDAKVSFRGKPPKSPSK